LENALDIIETHAPDLSVLLKANINRIKRSSGLGITTKEDEDKIRQKTIKVVLDLIKENY